MKKIRVLNARSAAWVASSYNPGFPVQIYRPASADHTQIKWGTQSGQASSEWFEANLLVGFSAVGTIEAWDYNHPSDAYGKWAGAYTKFKNRRIYGYSVMGTAYLLDAQDIVRQAVQNPAFNATQTGWVNGQYVNLYN